ncbi:MAG TPA: PH domain-containing protein [Miltoncostaeales bacterium]|jgi:uncharacterized membrane protein YdbT with pleckstrin-like domain|nr:PH domain-containing protein [Miltoncostaeales bacterium]
MELHPTERLIWRGHPAARAYVGWYAKWGILAILPALVTTLMRSQDRGIGMAYWKWVALSVVLLVLLVGIDVVRRATIDYVVTDQRIRIRRGTLSRREQSTNIEKIQNINTFQSVLGRMLGIGDVEFGTAGSEVADASLRFEGIARPHELVARLEGHRTRDQETTTT